MKVALAVFCFFSSSVLSAALSPEAQSYLSKAPDSRLSLPFVIKLALQNAQGYKIIGYNHASAGLEEMGQFDAMTDTLFTAKAEYTDDNAARTISFLGLRNKMWDWNLGLAKRWSTGTTTSVGWLYENNDQDFPPLGPGSGFSGAIVPVFKQSTATIAIEQSLLRDSFGYAFRKKRMGARARASAIQWNTRNEFENLTLQFMSQYYQAWLLQQQVDSLQEQVKRRENLFKILQRRSRKGAVEKPDLIQVEALLASTKASLSQARSNLALRWDELVISLALPTEFLAEDPMDVPTTIDNPVPLGLRICGQKEPVKTAEVYALEKNLESLDFDFKAAKNESLPDLKLIAGYRGNSIDDEASVTVENVLAGRDDEGFGRGLAWNVGLSLSWPLNNSGAKAMRTQKYIEKEQTAARLQIAVDGLKSQWRDSCRRLKAEWKTEKLYNTVVSEQKKRVRAEEKRFRLGRIGVNQLVTAEDDLSLWILQSHQKKIEVRQLAWQVQKQSGELYRFLAPHIEQLLESGRP